MKRTTVLSDASVYKSRSFWELIGLMPVIFTLPILRTERAGILIPPFYAGEDTA